MASSSRPVTFKVATSGTAKLGKNWTAEEHEAALDLMARGVGTKGQDIVAGTYLVHGQTVTLTPITDEEREAYEKEQQERESNRANARKLVFAAGMRGKRLAGDEMTERENDGRIKRKANNAMDSLHADLKKIRAEDGGLLTNSAAIADLIRALNEINGQDAYSNETQALGRLRATEFLVLPSDLPTPVVEVKDVGSGLAVDKFSPMYVFAVYALNRDIHDSTNDEERVKFGLLRMEAVKWGWVDVQREIRFRPTPANMMEVLERDMLLIRKWVEPAALAAWLVPLAAEHVFRTTGHHYLTNNAPAYNAKYDQIFRACLAPEVGKFLPVDALYHKALHWISPERVWNVVKANLEDDRIPEAIRIRATSAPSGTALITTSSAVLHAMHTTAIYKSLEDMNVADFKKITDMDETIRKNPPRYHKVPNAYGLAALTAAEKETLNAAKKEAEKLAPVTKAFVDTMLANAPLSRQKVLDKPSDNFPVVYENSKKLFLALKRMKPKNIEEVLAGALKLASG